MISISFSHEYRTIEMRSCRYLNTAISSVNLLACMGPHASRFVCQWPWYTLEYCMMMIMPSSISLQCRHCNCHNWKRLMLSTYFFYRTTLLSLVQRLRDDDDDDYYKITCLSKNVAVCVRQKYRNGTSLVAQ